MSRTRSDGDRGVGSFRVSATRDAYAFVAACAAFGEASTSGRLGALSRDAALPDTAGASGHLSSIPGSTVPLDANGGSRDGSRPRAERVARGGFSGGGPSGSVLGPPHL